MNIISSTMSFFSTLFAIYLTISAVDCDYWEKRDDFIKNEEAKAIGGSLVLSEKEEIVNDILMKIKLKEYDAGFLNRGTFLPAYHLFDTLEQIEESEVFQFIKLLPKGGMLHGHSTGLASADFVYNLTYSGNLYACVVNSRLVFHFFQEPVNDVTCDWTSVDVLRNASSEFDNFVKSQITLIRHDYRDVFTDINIVWSHFNDLFKTVSGLLTYVPVFERYFYQVLQELYDDNVMYLEFRSTLPILYDLNGNTFGPLDVASIYEDTLKRFMDTHHDFLGARLIYSPPRKVNNATMDQYVETAIALKKNFPDFLAGFDLVGQEDLGYPLSDFVNQILELKGQLRFFFHSGETNWSGTSTDLNLVDAVLLGTERIGHGYALFKHPDVMQVVKETKIGVEVCPISNQVLMLVGDARNHPGNYFIANDFPLVICSDDPSFWGTKGSSYDWYIAYMGMAARNADLRLLKQLAINSLEYSSLDDKVSAKAKWEGQWNNFINEMILKHMPDTFEYYYENILLV